MNSIFTSIYLFIFLAVLGILYRRYDDKLIEDSDINNNEAIKKYLLNGTSLGASSKPILWIHVPYEYNSRKWENFYSRSSFDLNQPYMYLTARSVIRQCKDDFTIVIIDDNSFEKLLPNWNINMKVISDPILYYIRKLGLMKLLHEYGGMLCPISFVCLKSLKTLYDTGCQATGMFVTEVINRNITATVNEFTASIDFCGCKKGNKTIKELVNFIERIISNDTTAEIKFTGDFSRWCMSRVLKKQMQLIDGTYTGTKTSSNHPILIENLLSSEFIELNKLAYGIYIMHDELKKRSRYNWFLKLSQQEVLESNTIIGKYILITNAPDSHKAPESQTHYNVENKKWIGFWTTPLFKKLYGLKPMFLGDNIPRENI
jgi:hypothetical protein|tara:strand:+ start:3440 stop:4558 length:1119 start_codon:yes stop_codon:yes gene_type:complete